MSHNHIEFLENIVDLSVDTLKYEKIKIQRTEEPYVPVVYTFGTDLFYNKNAYAYSNEIHKKIVLLSFFVSLKNVTELGYEIKVYTDEKGVFLWDYLYNEYYPNVTLLESNHLLISLEEEPSSYLWAYPKFGTYLMEKSKEFLHIDLDVIPIKSFPKSFRDYDFVFERNQIINKEYNKIINIEHYEKMDFAFHLPDYFKKSLEDKVRNSVSVGMVYVNDKQKFLPYVYDAIDFYYQLNKKWDKYNEQDKKIFGKSINQMIEQYMIECFIEHKDYKSNSYIGEPYTNCYKNQGYMHLVSRLVKQNTRVLDSLSTLVKQLNKDFYGKVLNFIDK